SRKPIPSPSIDSSAPCARERSGAFPLQWGSNAGIEPRGVATPPRQPPRRPPRPNPRRPTGGRKCGRSNSALSDPQITAKSNSERNRRVQRQAELPFRQWGGRRPGAGRKPNGDKAMVTHLTRPRLSGREPLHVTLRTVPAVKKLRTKARFRTIKCALAEGKNRFGFRLVHHSVQHGHIHLIVG